MPPQPLNGTKVTYRDRTYVVEDAGSSWNDINVRDFLTGKLRKISIATAIAEEAIQREGGWFIGASPIRSIVMKESQRGAISLSWLARSGIDLTNFVDVKVQYLGKQYVLLRHDSSAGLVVLEGWRDDRTCVISLELVLANSLDDNRIGLPIKSLQLHEPKAREVRPRREIGQTVSAAEQRRSCKFLRRSARPRRNRPERRRGCRLRTRGPSVHCFR